MSDRRDVCQSLIPPTGWGSRSARFTVPIEAITGVFFVIVALMFIGLGKVLGRAFDACPNWDVHDCRFLRSPSRGDRLPSPPFQCIGEHDVESDRTTEADVPTKPRRVGNKIEGVIGPIWKRAEPHEIRPAG